MPACIRWIALFTLLLSCGVGSARAHAILEGSEPKIAATVAEGDVALRLRFNSRIDHARSVLTLIRPDRSRTTLPIAADTAPEIVASRIALTPGAYVVRWQVLAVDGHITRGDVPFTVKGR